MMGEAITYGGSEPIKVQKDWGSFFRTRIGGMCALSIGKCRALKVEGERYMLDKGIEVMSG